MNTIIIIIRIRITFFDNLHRFFDFHANLKCVAINIITMKSGKKRLQVATYIRWKYHLGGKSLALQGKSSSFNEILSRKYLKEGNILRLHLSSPHPQLYRHHHQGLVEAKCVTGSHHTSTLGSLLSSDSSTTVYGTLHCILHCTVSYIALPFFSDTGCSVVVNTFSRYIGG